MLKDYDIWYMVQCNCPATHCNALQRTSAHYDMLQHIAGCVFLGVERLWGGYD